MIRELFNKVQKKGADWLFLDERLEDQELIEERRQTCYACPNYDAKNDKCKLCTCFVEIKTTMLKNKNIQKGMRVEITHCPDGRWNDADIAEYYKTN